MISEVIVLAGGFGTRLKGVIKDIPKPMAPINNKPFLEYLLNYLVQFNISRVILSVGYKHKLIQNYFHNKYKNIDIEYAIENEPLGTGGGIFNAMQYITIDKIIIINGDTFFNINLFDFYDFHTSLKSDLTIALKKMYKFDRYGTVKMQNHRIIDFQEKQYTNTGFINGGIYACNKKLFHNKIKQPKFSFEKDFMEKYVKKMNIIGFKSEDYFIDIGVPADYERAQNELINIY